MRQNLYKNSYKEEISFTGTKKVRRKLTRSSKRKTRGKPKLTLNEDIGYILVKKGKPVAEV